MVIDVIITFISHGPLVDNN